MAETITFERIYADFGDAVTRSERDPSILRALQRILHDEGVAYGLEDLLGAPFCALNLAAAGAPSDRLDLILKLHGYSFFEIVLWGNREHASPGGWLSGDEPVRITDEVVNDYPVIETTYAGQPLRHVFLPRFGGYEPDFGSVPAPLASAQRIAKRRSRFQSTTQKGRNE